MDLCALKRPYDDQSQSRIASETRAVLQITARIERGVDVLVWSSALTFENDADPDPEPRVEVMKYEALAAVLLQTNDEVKQRAHQFADFGIEPLDAIHIAPAEAGACDVLVTCDDRFIHRARPIKCGVRVMGPLEYISEVADD